MAASTRSKTAAEKKGAATTSEPLIDVVAPKPIMTVIDDLLPAEPDMADLSTVRVLVVGAVLLAFGTAGFFYIPGLISKDIDGSGSHLVNSFYCAAITLTTVGYGDICPVEPDMNGKIFLLLLSIGGLGMFCGPVMQLGAAWRHAIPGGLGALASFLVGLGVVIFTSVEGLEHLDAIYASIITGTTIGYGDATPQTDSGKLAVAMYAIISVNAMAILLDPARIFFEGLCRRPEPKAEDKKDKKD